MKWCLTQAKPRKIAQSKQQIQLNGFMNIGKKAFLSGGGIIVDRISTQQPRGIKKQYRINIKIQIGYKPSQQTIQQD